VARAVLEVVLGGSVGVVALVAEVIVARAPTQT
jgi:hypothetical protein